MADESNAFRLGVILKMIGIDVTDEALRDLREKVTGAVSDINATFNADVDTAATVASDAQRLNDEKAQETSEKLDVLAESSADLRSIVDDILAQVQLGTEHDADNATALNTISTSLADASTELGAVVLGTDALQGALKDLQDNGGDIGQGVQEVSDSLGGLVDRYNVVLDSLQNLLTTPAAQDISSKLAESMKDSLTALRDSTTDEDRKAALQTVIDRLDTIIKGNDAQRLNDEKAQETSETKPESTGLPPTGPGTRKDGEDEGRDGSRLDSKWSPIIMRGVSLGAQGIKDISQESMNFLQMIYRYIRQSAPLMQGIESLFNLAVTLFFLPFGTALGETLLPSLLDLVDDVADMWDAMDGMTLGEMADYMVEQAGKLFGSYIESIGESLSEQGGVLGSIGDFLQSLGSFIQENGASIINLMLSLASMLLDNFKEFVSLYVALQSAQIGATIGGSWILGNLIGPWGALAGAGITGAIGGLGTYGGLTALGLADGGYVPATQGGQIRLLAEGGEGEHVVPDSKVKDFADEHSSKGNSYMINVYGYTDSELTDRINDVINQQVAFSRLKGSFRWEEQPHSAPSGAGIRRSTA